MFKKSLDVLLDRGDLCHIIMQGKVYKNAVLRATEFEELPESINSITFNKCTTADWMSVVDRLAKLKNLRELHVIDCRKCEIASANLSSLKIVKLTLGNVEVNGENCDLEDYQLKQIKELKNLKEVNLGRF